jgi:hypothetical protein
MSKLALRTAAAALAGILIAIGGCAESPSSPAAQPQLLRAPAAPGFARSAAAVIGQEGGSLQTADGHRIVFPAGALSQPTEISMTSVAGYAGVNLEPHGMVFPAGREPVLTIDIGSAATAGFQRFDIVYVDESGAISEVLPTEVLGNSGKLRANLRHFSGYMASGY